MTDKTYSVYVKFNGTKAEPKRLLGKGMTLGCANNVRDSLDRSETELFEAVGRKRYEELKGATDDGSPAVEFIVEEDAPEKEAEQ